MVYTYLYGIFSLKKEEILIVLHHGQTLKTLCTNFEDIMQGNEPVMGQILYDSTYINYIVKFIEIKSRRLWESGE